MDTELEYSANVAREVGFKLSNPNYQHWSMLSFSSWEAMDLYASKIQNTFVTDKTNLFKTYVNRNIRSNSYGMFGKNPTSFDDGMARKKFVYWEEYKRIKASAEKKIRAELAKKSEATITEPKFVYNTVLGEFIFERAAMSLEPDVYYYSPSLDREIDLAVEKIIEDGGVMKLESDGSLVLLCLKSETETGKFEYTPMGENALEEANKKGVVWCSSSNKKVYLYKEKRPKSKNAIKILVYLTMGGWTGWVNDFYTGIGAVCCLEILESMGYSVHLEVVMGGGRCPRCGMTLNFGKNCIHKGISYDHSRVIGRRFFSFTAKNFDEQPDLGSILYTVADPSFHNIRFMGRLYSFFSQYGDEFSDTDADPVKTWHGIEESDLVFPLGMFFKSQDAKKEIGNVIYFNIWRIENENAIATLISDLVLTSEKKNNQAYQLMMAGKVK